MDQDRFIRPAILFTILFSFMLPIRRMFVGNVGPITINVTRVLGIIIFFLFIIKVVLTADEDLRITRIHVYLVLLSVWSAVSVIWAIDTGLVIRRALKYLLSAVFIIMIYNIIEQKRHLFYTFQSLVVGSAVTVVILYGKYFNGASFTSGRYTAAGAGANRLAGELALVIVVAVLLLTVFERSRKWDLFNALFLLISYPAMWLTGSRQGLLASLFPLALSGFLMLRKMERRSVNLFSGFVLVSIVVAATAYFIANPVLDVPTVDFDRSISSRITRIVFGLELFVERPILGFGAGNYPVMYEHSFSEFGTSHNTWTTIASELGVVGLGIFSVVIVYIIRVSCSVKKLAPHSLIIIAVWVFLSNTNNWGQTIFTWYLFILFILRIHLEPAVSWISLSGRNQTETS